MADESYYKVLLQIQDSLSTNTEATKNIERHLETLNGKVATQESFTRTLKTALDLQSTTMNGLVEREKSRAENRSRIAWLTLDNIFKFVFGVAMTYLLYKAGF